MIAKIQEDGTLFYIPNSFDGWDNFQNASKELQESYGFFEVIKQEISVNQKYGNPYFDEENRVIKFYAEEVNPIVITYNEIKTTREMLYKMRSDSLYMAYQKYLALGNIEAAEIKKAEWIAEVQKIDQENPYNS